MDSSSPKANQCRRPVGSSVSASRQLSRGMPTTPRGSQPASRSPSAEGRRTPRNSQIIGHKAVSGTNGTREEPQTPSSPQHPGPVVVRQTSLTARAWQAHGGDGSLASSALLAPQPSAPTTPRGSSAPLTPTQSSVAGSFVVAAGIAPQSVQSAARQPQTVWPLGFNPGASASVPPPSCASGGAALRCAAAPALGAPSNVGAELDFLCGAAVRRSPSSHVLDNRVMQAGQAGPLLQSPRFGMRVASSPQLVSCGPLTAESRGTKTSL